MPTEQLGCNRFLALCYAHVMQWLIRLTCQLSHCWLGSLRRGARRAWSGSKQDVGDSHKAHLNEFASALFAVGLSGVRLWSVRRLNWSNNLYFIESRMDTDGNEKKTRSRLTSTLHLLNTERKGSTGVADWPAEYLHELTTFPSAKYDDQADSTSQALD
jgi:hypothetical protein